MFSQAIKFFSTMIVLSAFFPAIASATSYYVYIQNINGTSTPYPGGGAKITPSNSAGGGIVCNAADLNGKVTCVVDNAGNVTHALYNTNGAAGTEYWGYVVDYIDSSDQLTTKSFIRNMPYVSSVAFQSDYSSSTYTTTPAYTGTGTGKATISVVKPSTSYPYGSFSNMSVYLDVKNPGGSSYTAYGPIQPHEFWRCNR